MSFDDSYVVRIYRRSSDRMALTGTVEHAESGARSTFHDFEELWAALVRIQGGTFDESKHLAGNGSDGARRGGNRPRRRRA